MPTYLAVVHLERAERVFVIRSPDFPGIEVRCPRFDDAEDAAQQAIRSEISKLKTQGRALPGATEKGSLESRREYRNCFLIAVESPDDS